MKPRITMLTLGVENLERALVFYRDGLGLPTEGIIGEEFEHGLQLMLPSLTIVMFSPTSTILTAIVSTKGKLGRRAETHRMPKWAGT